MKKPYIFLDAGGTIIFPNAELLCEIALNFGYFLSPENLIKAFLETTFYFDNLFKKEGLKDNKVFYNFIPLSLEKLGVPLEEGIKIREIAMKKANGLIWTYTLPSIKEGLRILNSEGYSLSVISNSDGTVEEQIRRAGLRKYFERIYDSGIIGIEKPDPKIFLHALSEMKFSPKEVIYIGDFVMIDVLGANKAKIGAIHLDPLSLYNDWKGIHLKDIHEVAIKILEGEIKLEDKNLFPFLEEL
ncbi:MAG: HAD family hydrolase [Dictyoglomaceae bacterium]